LQFFVTLGPRRWYSRASRPLAAMGFARTAPAVAVAAAAAALVLLVTAPPAAALHFYLLPGQRRCFTEDLPLNTLVRSVRPHRRRTEVGAAGWGSATTGGCGNQSDDASAWVLVFLSS